MFRRRRRNPHWLVTIGIASAFVALLVCMPLILPFVLLSVERDRRRLRRAANTFACLKCGNAIGAAGVKLADAAVAAEAAEFARLHPGIRRRTVRSLDAICPRCGARYSFNREALAFSPLDEPDDAHNT